MTERCAFVNVLLFCMRTIGSVAEVLRPSLWGKPDERTHTMGLAFLQHLLEITGRIVSPLTQCPVEVSMLPGKFQLYSLGPKSGCLHLRLRATSSLASGQKLPNLPPGTRLAGIGKGNLFHSHQM